MQPFRTPKVSLRWAIFVQSISGLSLKKTDELSFMTLNSMQKLNKPCDLVVSKIAWRIGWTFIRALKNLKNCTLMGSFCPQNIMFQSEISEELCVMTLIGDANFKGKLTRGLKNNRSNLVNSHASS